MTATELECRVSWVNAALRFYGRELNHLHALYASWHQRHGALCTYGGSRGLKFDNL